MIDRVICPKCAAEGEKSEVRDHGSTGTLVYYRPFYDEDGRKHHHDGNKYTTSYSCSRGHNFTEVTSGTCWCGWQGQVTKDKT